MPGIRRVWKAEPDVKRRRLGLFEQLEPRRLLTVVTFDPAADNTLYEHPNGSLSNGEGQYLFAGRTARRLPLSTMSA